MNPSNPLSKHFRHPKLSVKLPSMGRFQPEGNFSYTPTGEVQIVAMRAQDEMIMKSPDALMTGAAVEQVLLSCVPGLKNAKIVPMPDVDVLMLAIRAATYGNAMEIETECPECQTLNGYSIDIPTLIDTAKPLDSEYSVRLADDLVVFVKPFSYSSGTRISTTLFQETRKLQLLEQSDAPEELQQAQRNLSFKNLHEVNLRMIADSVEKVVSGDNTVIDPIYLGEFVNNIDASMSKMISDRIKDLNGSGLDKNHHVTCSKCNHEWTTIIEADPASFFDQDS